MTHQSHHALTTHHAAHAGPETGEPIHVTTDYVGNVPPRGMRRERLQTEAPQAGSAPGLDVEGRIQDVLTPASPQVRDGLGDLSLGQTVEVSPAVQQAVNSERDDTGLTEEQRQLLAETDALIAELNEPMDVLPSVNSDDPLIAGSRDPSDLTSGFRIIDNSEL